MTRYFYDCPLKAGYMAMYHGIRTSSPLKGNKLYVVGECVPLLVPMLHDVIVFADEGQLFYHRIENEMMKDMCVSHHIVLRKGEAFIMPEVEI